MPQLSDVAWRAQVEEKYPHMLSRLKNGAQFSAVARDFGVHPATVTRIARRAGIVSRTSSERILAAAREELGVTPDAVLARRFGVDRKTVYRLRVRVAKETPR